MPGKIAYIGEKIVKLIAVVPMLLVTFLTLFYQNNVAMDVSEASIVSHNGVEMIVLLIAMMLFGTGICFLLNKINSNRLFIILSVLYVGLGLYFITHVYMTQRFDAGICYDSAHMFLQGDYTNFRFGEYFYEHPHQLGLLLYDTILIALCDKVSFIYCVNLVWVIAGIFCMWQSVRAESTGVLKQKITIFFSFAFFPQFLFAFFAYGLVPGLGCVAVGLLFWIIYFRKRHMLWAVCGSLFIGIACLIRMNYVIAGIAVTIICVFEEVKQKKWRAVQMVALVSVLIIMILGPKMLLVKGYEEITDSDLSQGMPMILYIAMGLQEDDVRAAGWYSGFNHDTYVACGYDVEISAGIATRAIEERLNFFAQNPKEMFDFFSEKIITTWCEPTYQSVWSGPLIGVTGKTNVPWLQEFYSGGDNYKIFVFLMNGFNTIIFGMATVGVLWNVIWEKKPIGAVNLFGILFFLGGFLFHIFWETKSQYVYPYVVCLLPVAAYGVDAMWSGIKNKCGSITKKGIKKNNDQNV